MDAATGAVTASIIDETIERIEAGLVSPSSKPADDYVWRGKEPVGGDKGACINPNTGEQWHPDLDHPLPKGPHWDYADIDGIVWSVFKDGRIILW